jgi:hypothetical protein
MQIQIMTLFIIKNEGETHVKEIQQTCKRSCEGIREERLQQSEIEADWWRNRWQSMENEAKQKEAIRPPYTFA